MAAAKSHFQRTNKRESELEKKGDYVGTCEKNGAADKGFMSSVERRSEVHHLMCEHSVAERYDEFTPSDPDVIPYLEDCLWVTKWNINAGPNLIGMPRNRQFRLDWSTLPRAQWLPEDLPSHMVDHNTADGYTHDVKVWIQKNVFNEIRAKKAPHQTDIDQLQQQLENGSKHWRKILTKVYGIREGGTREGWAHRLDKDHERTWYHPFSMGKKPSHRYAGTPARALKVFKKLDS